MSPDSLCDLLRRCGREGSFPRPASAAGSAWDELVERVGPYLEICVRRSLRRLEVAPRDGEVEEVVQEIYFRLLDHGGRRLRSFAGHHAGQGQAFLRQVAHRVILDRVRHAEACKRSGKGSGNLSRAMRLPASELGFRPHGDPERHLLARERMRELFERCRAAGGRRHQDRNLHILQLALVEGRSSREISHKLGGRLTPSSVDSVIHRLRRRLAGTDASLRHRPPAAGVAARGRIDYDAVP